MCFAEELSWKNLSVMTADKLLLPDVFQSGAPSPKTAAGTSPLPLLAQGVHECLGGDVRDFSGALGFALAAIAARHRDKTKANAPVLWLTLEREARESGALYPPGAGVYGFAADAFIMGVAHTERDLLWGAGGRCCNTGPCWCDCPDGISNPQPYGGPGTALWLHRQPAAEAARPALRHPCLYSASPPRHDSHRSRRALAHYGPSRHGCRDQCSRHATARAASLACAAGEKQQPGTAGLGFGVGS